MTRITLLLVVTFVALGARTVQAQAPVSPGPSRSASVAGIVVSAAARPVAEPAPAPMTRAKSRAFMIVGGVAFIGGLLVGDTAGTAIAIGGLGLGVYGLYFYLQ
jgi:hypothetical protein